MQEKKLIINADDFGFSEAINRGIIDGYKNGIITSCSIMASAEYFDDAFEKLKEAPNLSVGVHLTLTNTKPTLPKGQVPFLVNRNSTFYHSPSTIIQRFILFPVSLQQAKAELRNQIQKVIQKGIKPSHLDTHKHLHLFMPLFKIIIQLALEFNIRIIRIPYDSIKIKNKFKKNKIKRFINRSLFVRQKRMKKYLIENSLKFPNHFFGFSYTGQLNEKILIEVIKSLPFGTTELMCHPGYCYDLISMPTRLKESREIELKALQSQIVKELINRNGIKLVNHEGIV